MKKIFVRIVSHPRYFDALLYAGKYATVVQLIAAFVFLGFSRCGAPLGCLYYAEQMRQAAMISLSLTAGSAVCAKILHKYGARF